MHYYHVINIADIVGGLHRVGDWNKAHEVMPLSPDRDSSDRIKQSAKFLIGCEAESAQKHW